ncbi:MAG: hypothetical protein SH868_01805 [Bythopirellula sp.]|nr:hypothetical protein [Bythopirellula sp.]
MKFLPRLMILLAVVLTWNVSSAIHAQEPKVTGIRIGFADNYKLGCWTPLEVELTGGAKPQLGIVTVTVPDGDGVPTTVASPENRPIALEPGKKTTLRLFVRVGQSYSSLQVKFIDDEGKVATARVFYAGPVAQAGTLPSGLPATNRLLVEFGPPIGLADLTVNDSSDELTQTRIARVDRAVDLPTEWYGYEGADTVILTTSRPDLYRPLAQNPARVEALRHWVEMGGKLVIFCGSESDELLVEGGALAELLPGKFTETVTIEQSQPIEAFGGAEDSITPTRRVDFRVPMFADLRGKVLASAKRGQTDVPLVIRSYIGFGELTFIGLDFDKPPLVDWAGRKSFLSKALNLNTEASAQQQNTGVAEVSSDDLIGQVRNTLDESFEGVEVVPFALVAVLVVGYILLIGPGDYFLVNKVFKRPEMTWITFPITVVAVSAAAYWFANWQKGDQLRVNQVEFVDVDATTGFTRGTVWTHFFTPQVAKFDLSLEPAFLKQKAVADSTELVAWLGQPGYGLGGMQNSSGQTSMFDRGYAFNTALDKMLGLPVQLWSTKTITSRWSADVTAPVETTLNRTDEQLLLGQIVNSTDAAFEDCVLLYGQWAWSLGSIPAGSAVNVLDASQPRTVRTLLTSATAGETTITETADDGTVPFRLANADITRLAKTMMFFHAVNGQRYSGMLSRYQGFLDMSHLLDQPDVAILLAKASKPGSQWLDGDKPLGSDQDLNWTYYRFVVPVGPLVESN